MKRLVFSFLVLFLFCADGQAQHVVWPPESIKALTAEWKGERMPDGRPKVSDQLLERLKGLSMEEVWGSLRREGYNNQFENFAGTHGNSCQNPASWA